MNWRHGLQRLLPIGFLALVRFKAYPLSASIRLADDSPAKFWLALPGAPLGIAVMALLVGGALQGFFKSN
jgi:hypothetical protein